MNRPRCGEGPTIRRGSSAQRVADPLRVKSKETRNGFNVTRHCRLKSLNRPARMVGSIRRRQHGAIKATRVREIVRRHRDATQLCRVVRGNPVVDGGRTVPIEEGIDRMRVGDIAECVVHGRTEGKLGIGG